MPRRKARRPLTRRQCSPRCLRSRRAWRRLCRRRRPTRRLRRRLRRRPRRSRRSRRLTRLSSMRRPGLTGTRSRRTTSSTVRAQRPAVARHYGLGSSKRLARGWVAGYPSWNGYGQPTWPAPAYGGCANQFLPRCSCPPWKELVSDVSSAQQVLARNTCASKRTCRCARCRARRCCAQASCPLVRLWLPSAQLTVQRCAQAMVRPPRSSPRQHGRRRGRELRRRRRSPSLGLRCRRSCPSPGLVHRCRPGQAWRALAAALPPRQHPAGRLCGSRPRGLSSGRRWVSASSRTHLRRRT